jgi:hypothetical protein
MPTKHPAAAPSFAEASEGEGHAAAGRHLKGRIASRQPMQAEAANARDQPSRPVRLVSAKAKRTDARAGA